MKLEMHVIQNFAPSNLNRDDTGSPKDCEFGGHRRARISSQCFKRAMREYFDDKALLANRRAVRTKRILDALVESLKSKGKKEEEIKAVVKVALSTSSLKIKDDGKSEYLIFVGKSGIDELGKALIEPEIWQGLLDAAKPAAEAKDDEGKKAKKKKTTDLPKEFKAKVGAVVDKLLASGNAADIAMFGRMLADAPERNVDAACQVAHAISTNRVNMEFDFYTAVDDLNPKEETGAGMMGVIEFNSSCFYRYMNVDLDQLVKNLDGDADVAKEAMLAFMNAAINAIPTGKQKSMAAQNPPSLVMAVVREDDFWSLANAFEKPVRASDKDGLVDLSIKRLAEYWESLCTVYGKPKAAKVFYAGTNTAAIGSDLAKKLGFQACKSFTELLEITSNNLAFAKTD